MSESTPPSDSDKLLEQSGFDEHQIMAERRAKLEALRASTTAFPNDVRPAHRAAALHQRYEQHSREQLESEHVQVTVAGRMMLKRVQGKASFATLQDATGRIQIYLNDEGVGTDSYEAFKHWDLGDILFADGVLFKTMKGELSIRCRLIRLISKSLRPLNDKFHGVDVTDTRYRQRYGALIVNSESREIFTARSKTLSAIRHFMNDHGFLEVETPMLQRIPGGAAAKPFVTHHNALDQQMFLRIAPELFLKRLIVGGFERVYEINRNFRNEGLSPRHNPEFKMMEFYAAYTDYQWLMDFTEQVLRHAAETATGAAVLN
ncbi:MAG: amino acid--tRNA ligase-related protein, partial [Betaproteobacteria bacterium]